MCGRENNQLMIQCDTCFGWTHYSCVSLLSRQVDELDTWECGFCCSVLETPDGKVWDTKLVPLSKRAASKGALCRPEELKPTQKRARRKHNPEEWKGTRNWDELQREIVEHAKELAVLLKREKKLAETILKTKSHHITDTIGPGGLQQAINDPITRGILLDQIAPDDRPRLSD